MTSIKFLASLLDGADVEWKKLGDVIKLEKGRQLNKELLSEQGLYPAYNGGISHSGFTDTFNYTENKTIVSQGGASAGFVNFVTSKFYANAHCYVVLPNARVVVNRYVFHLLKLNQGRLTGKQHGAGIPALRTGEILEIPIPIPCPQNQKKSLEIQAEIVRILDVFTSHTAELTTELNTELNTRKRQYNYYRDHLLSFEEGEVEWRTLPEMALEFGRGKSKHRPRNDEKLYGGDTPFIQTGDIRSASHTIIQYSQTYSEFGLRQSKLWPKGTLCITIAANIAETSILGFDACFPDSVIGFVADPKKTSSGYVEYLLQSTKKKLEEKGKEKSSAQSNINLGTFEQLKLPFPSLTEQARIVAILDKFDAITNSISEDLPREIELRQKQYEYYRDLLLSFPKPEEVKA